MSAPSHRLFRRAIATVAAGATLVAAGGLATPAFAAAAGDTFIVSGTSTVAASSASTQSVTVTGTANNTTMFSSTSTLGLALNDTVDAGAAKDIATFASTAAATATPSSTLSASGSAYLLDPGKYNLTATGIAGQTAIGTNDFTVTGTALSTSAFTVAQNDNSTSNDIGANSVKRTWTLTGSNFTLGTTVTVDPKAGLTLTENAVTSPTMITGTIVPTTSPANAATYKLTVTQPGTFSAGSDTKQSVVVTPAPTVASGSSTNPASDASTARIAAGDSNNPIGFTGSGFQTNAALTYSASSTAQTASGVTAASAPVVNTPTSITAPLTVASATQAPAPVSVTVTNPDGGSVTTPTTATSTANVVLRTTAAHPTVTSVSPDVVAGTATTVTITGTGFISTPAVTIPDDTAGDLTVSAVAFKSATSLTATITAKATTAMSAYKVTVTNPDAAGSTPAAMTAGPAGTCTNECLTVDLFSVTSLLTTQGSAPAAGNVGSTSLTVTGSGFVTEPDNYYAIVLTPPATDPGQPTITTPVAAANVKSGSLVATVNLDAAEAGNYAVSVTASGSRGIACTTGSGNGCPFAVTANTPTVTSISPTKLVPGQTATVTITGTNFSNGSTVALTTSSPDLTVSNTKVVSSTSITITVAVVTGASTTTSNSHTFTVTTPDGQTVVTPALSVVPAPVLTSAVPTAVTAGGAAPSTTNGSYTVTNPTGGETFDGASGDGGKLAVTLMVTGPTGLSASTIHVTDAAGNVVAFTAATGGGVTGSFPAATSTPGTAPKTNYTLTLDSGVSAGTLTVKAALAEAGTTNTYSPQSGMTTVNTEPGVPTITGITNGVKQAVVAFTAPGSNGGLAITGYKATATPTSGSTGVVTMTSTNTTAPLSITIANLVAGVQYNVTVAASNDSPPANYGTASPAMTASPYDVTSAPTNVAATAGNASAAVTWTAPTSTNGSAVSDYIILVTPMGGTATTVDTKGTTTSYMVTGLTNGTSYTFAVMAVNAAGNSAASAPSSAVTPSTVPGAPTNVVATKGNGQAMLTWTAPASTGGMPITDYTIMVMPAGGTATTIDTKSTTASYTVTGLTNGTAYTFAVAATNATGMGTYSTASTAVTPSTVPDAPTGAMAAPGNTSAKVSWTAPANTGGAPITDYVITVMPAGGTASTVDTMSTGTSYTVMGLTNGTSYTFTVMAKNLNGPGAASTATSAVTPSTVPGAPTNVVATKGNGQAMLTWTAPASTGGMPITDYTIMVMPAGGTATTIDTKSTTASYTVTGLTNGTAYTFAVAATNATGMGTYSTASTAVTPSTVPDAPTGAMAAPGNTSAKVSWTAPANTGGAPITDYVITVMPAGGTASTVDTMSTGTSYTVMGLTNGTSYTFTVMAKNLNGPGAASTATLAVTPAAVPTAPTNVMAKAGNVSVAVSWTASTIGTGDPAITDYKINVTPNGAPSYVVDTKSTTASYTVTGLTNGTSYSFTVFAVNSAGNSFPSDPPVSATPSTVPGAPTNPAAAANGTSVTVTWTAPASNGGSVITSYTVTASNGQTMKVTGTTATYTGLIYGTSYTFTVVATNSNGNGPASGASSPVTITGAPSTPAAPTVTSANGTITATFTAPAANGSPITGYTAIATPVNGGAAVSQAGTTSPITITGLTNGVSDVVRITATNAAGTSPASPASAQIAPVAPATSGPATVSLKESKTFTTFGQQSTLFGVVARGGVVTPNTQVTLTVTYTDGKVVTLGAATTSVDGSYSYRYTPIYNGTIVATALGARSNGVLAKVIVTFTKITATSRGGVLTVKASTAPGFLTGANRNERAQILLVDSHGRQLRVLGIVNAAQRHGAAGQAHGVNDISFTTTSLAAGSYRIEVKVIGTPVNTGAASKIAAVRVQ